VSIRFEFAPNEYFEDAVLEKRFWHRRSRDGWSGLVSEPVRIQWKRERDLTGGLLDMVCAAWETEKSIPSRPKREAEGLTPEQRALKKKIENTGMGGLSFFAWFGFIGRKISAEESAAAVAKEKEKKAARKMKRASTPESEGSEDESEEEDDVGMSLEIFPDGDDLAVAFTDDLWPGAIKYFSALLPCFLFPHLSIVANSFPAQAQEQDALSDADFESDDDEDLDEAPDNSGDEESELDSGRPAKKQRSA
jgi:hypothetical protein